MANKPSPKPTGKMAQAAKAGAKAKPLPAPKTGADVMKMSGEQWQKYSETKRKAAEKRIAAVQRRATNSRKTAGKGTM